MGARRDFTRNGIKSLTTQTIFTVSAAALGLAGAAYLSPWVWRQQRMSRLRREFAKNRLLALTYDDGPSPIVTPQVLDLLHRRDARATFFMLGRQAQQHPDIAERVVREGHTAGCHSDQHLNALKSLPSKAVADIRVGYQQLSPWVAPDGMFRPPYGKMTLPTYLEVRRRGASAWWWTVDSGDTFETLPRVNDIADKVRKEGGGIVLMHDLDRGAQRNEFVLELTESLLDVAARESLQVRPLGELVQ
jgi:peptidoglycan-N-acetylglucosamine deacetylase